MTVSNDNDALPEDTRPNGDDAADAEIAALRAEIESLKDRSLRALAEVENVRKRLERERDEARTYSVTRFARDMLSVADNLTRALAALTPEARAKTDDALKPVLEGVEATARELQAALARHGIKLIEAEGQRFDPNRHQAIAEVAGPSPGTVVHVVQPGYTIGDRLLRPAMVTVAKGEAPNGSSGRVDTQA
ncbi:MAG TPA: nucleotide exchange factor GrpE [Micropepsaceae bacterium]|nr:nucleotide exchange factor GrpE [Micropepsaceae bacterium]